MSSEYTSPRSLSRVLALSTFLITRPEPAHSRHDLRARFTCVVERPGNIETMQSLPVPRRDQRTGRIENPQRPRPSLFNVKLYSHPNYEWPHVEDLETILRRHFRPSGVRRRYMVDEFYRAGRTFAGPYTHEVAETKVIEVRNDTRRKSLNIIPVCERAEP